MKTPRLVSEIRPRLLRRRRPSMAPALGCFHARRGAIGLPELYRPLARRRR